MAEFICNGSRSSKWYWNAETGIVMREMDRRRGMTVSMYKPEFIMDLKDDSDPSVPVLKKFLTNSGIMPENGT